MKTENFDLEDLKNLGRPKHFILADYLEVVRQLVASDEIALALNMLDNMPGWYRDTVPQAVVAMRAAINRDTMSVFDYARDPVESDHEHESLQMDHAHCYPRGPLLRKLVQTLNERGVTPHIHEISPANFWVRRGLQDAGCAFGYSWDRLTPGGPSTLPWFFELQTNAKIFVCFETLEHLYRPDDIKHWADKAAPADGWDYVLVSTPNLCLFHGLDWAPERPRELGHLRTYSPTELSAFMARNWPGYFVHVLTSNMQVAVASKRPLDVDLTV